MNCIQIKSISELEQYLIDNGRSLLEEDYQMPTNFGAIYKLNTGELVFIPNSLNDKYHGFVFKDEQCFNDVLAKDRFPIENPDKQIYEFEIENILKLNDNYSYQHQYLNTRLKLNYKKVNDNNINDYYQKLLKLNEKIEPKDFIALGVLLGRLLESKRSGRWILLKRYGLYNPYYVPHFIDKKNYIYPYYDRLYSMIESKIKNVDYYFEIREELSPKFHLNNINGVSVSIREL